MTTEPISHTDHEALKAEIANLQAKLAAIDKVVVYYVSQGWPSYSERERADKTWIPEMMVAQTEALNRHLARSKIKGWRVEDKP